LIIEAPARTAASITSGLLVSIDTVAERSFATPSITGITRASSSPADTDCAPGRVDSPPTSMTVAPWSSI
jgi:hypothetical protein